jgi:hypothetical protein
MTDPGRNVAELSGTRRRTTSLFMLVGLLACVLSQQHAYGFPGYGVSGYLYSRFPNKPGDNTPFYRPNITFLYAGQSIDILWDVTKDMQLGYAINDIYIDAPNAAPQTPYIGVHGASSTMLNYTPPTPGLYRIYGRVYTSPPYDWQTLDEFDINVVQGPAPAATITSDSTTITLGQTTTIRANFTLPGGDPAVGSNIDLNTVGTPAPGQDGSAQPSRTYTFTPTASGSYNFYADIKTGYKDWTNYSGYYSYNNGQYATGLNYVTVTVVVPPSITTQPVPQIVASGQGATFSIVATGYPAPTYQWQISTDNQVTWNNLSDGGIYSNTQTATLSVGAQTSASSNHWYRCLVSNSASPSPIHSSPALLTINPGPYDNGTGSTVPTLPEWALISFIALVFLGALATIPNKHRAG